MTIKVVTIIQARTTSTRLPNKVLLSVADKPLLLHMVERVQKAKYSDTVVVATTNNSEDDQIVELCKQNNIECFRGHPTDLLDRHYKTALEYDGDVIVKIPSDCPLIDPKIIDHVIGYYLDNIETFDFVSNLIPASYPDGNDVEVMSIELLKHTWKEAKLNYEREHTTPYIWTQPNKFRIGNIIWGNGLNYSSSHRWTLDYEEDYTFIRSVFEELYNEDPDFGLYDILELIKEKPHLGKINSMHAGKFWHNNEPVNIPKLKTELI